MRAVFPVRDLQTFTPAELVMMTAAVEEDWTVESASPLSLFIFLALGRLRERNLLTVVPLPLAALTNSAKADHGFTMDSRPVRDFLSIMADFSAEERREFLSFITGSCVVVVPLFDLLVGLALTLLIPPPLQASPPDRRLRRAQSAAHDRAQGRRRRGAPLGHDVRPPHSLLFSLSFSLFLADSLLLSLSRCVNYVKLPNYSSRAVVRERILMAVREGADGFHLS